MKLILPLFLLFPILSIGQNNNLAYSTSLAEALKNPKEVRYLDLTFQKIGTLPDEIGEITNLETLLLQGNGLTHLPASIGKLTKLRKLVVYSNELTSIPSTIGNLVELRELDLHRNQIKELPSSVGNLEKLERLKSH